MNITNDNEEFKFYNLQAVKRDFSFDIPIDINSSILIDAINSVKLTSLMTLNFLISLF